MANRSRGEVDLAGHTLVINTNALCELEDALGMGVARIAELLRDTESLRLSTIRKIIWVGLRQRHPGMTEEGAGEVIDAAGGPSAAGQVIGEAFRAAFPPEPSQASEGQSAARPPVRLKTAPAETG